jgi:hypothetical protein
MRGLGRFLVASAGPAEATDIQKTAKGIRMIHFCGFTFCSFAVFTRFAHESGSGHYPPAAIRSERR